ncbi:retinoic acid-induced protein 3 isoform X1 [Pantherophis guttatus]|uniref:Retinoic acid-induced protein 3 isoform X1 n=1 Tax=Pantherophis guttatus TaxID=94885 RepID=A0A6P9AJK9_PANGU|nr:retinoic acid-induced protein 3 isoform X1 [Pantherophis guttatus]
MPTTHPPLGCGNISNDYYFLCDINVYWGIILEALAAAGVFVTIILILVLFCLISKAQDNAKRSLIPIQFLFLLGTLGIFGLTFAFIIRLNEQTGPTRFFLFGVLFALCFSCLLAHALDLTKLVRGRRPFSALVLLIMVLGFTVVQVIIAIQYVAVNITALKALRHVMDEERRRDFILILIYVFFLMFLLFIVSMFVLCGSYKRWKRHGVHLLLTALFSIGIWVAWIAILMHGIHALGERSKWNDPLLGTVLIVNGWLFLILYAIPELCVLTSPRKPGDYPLENNTCQPKGMKKTYGIENQGYAQEDNTQEENTDSYVPYSTHFQLKNLEPQQEFSIPRPKARPSPYQEYSGGKGIKQ